MSKKSISLKGHRTSIALEQEFWDALQAIADVKEMSLPQLVAEIDEARLCANLSSALRVFTLHYYRNQSEQF